MNRDVRTVDDLLRLLDGLFDDRAAPDWWDRFYADRGRPVPFFADLPDESLDTWLRNGPLHGGRALELGCGPGRNALRLAAAGYEVDAVDLSPAAIAWARASGQDPPSQGVRPRSSVSGPSDEKLPEAAVRLH
ncbi:class I SAM-dependent methyltransferase [Amycolatopsis tolypomycina]|uniref:class I SAM-dependent methyltransferase n=1 Tax=Amycolatopsis tolypomycina TaxID=208445 RepID=UPI000AE339F0|nr:class I SAM-dependent methyltransferase [Amycolatopsis tolypomycina]